MGFNFGALAGGAAKGIESGTNIADQIQQRRLREAQLNLFNANNLGQQAFTNSLIPGSAPMPQGANPGGGTMDTLSRLPLVGQIGRELGLWGDVPGGQGAPQAGGMSAPQPGMPPAGQPSGMAPQPSSPSPSPAGQPQPAGGDITNTVAQAIDRANPGLRMSNPAAFSAAVMMGVEHAKSQQAAMLDTDYKRAQITGMGSENELRQAQAKNIPVQTDLTRAQIDNQKAETAIRGEELKIVPAKLKLQEAEVKLREAQATAAQEKMRLDEAELNAKEGDFNSQREWRDAQIANIRAERMLKMEKQKVDELKTKAETEELGTRSQKNTAEAGYAERRGLGPGDQDKLIHQELTKSQVQLRFHENQINDLMTSMTPNDPKIKARIAEHMRSATAYRARVDDLEGQLSTAPQPQAAPAPKEAPAIPQPRQQELTKASQKFLELAKANDMEGAKRLKDLMLSKGVPQHEVEWALQNARTMGTTSTPAPLTSSGPQIPQ